MLLLRGLGALLLLGGVVPLRHPHVAEVAPTAAPIELPDTSGINGQLTANLSVDQFFGLWIVFNEGVEAHVSGKFHFRFASF